MKKTNNKGFSLVELIVVVAIMAVLMVVLAPQYLKYVEKTRLQKDNSTIAEIANAMKIAAADEKINNEIVGAAAGVPIKLANDNDTEQAGKKQIFYGTTELEKEVKTTIPSFTTESNTYAKSAKDITLTIKIDANGAIVVEAAGMITTPNATSPDATQPKF